MTPDEIRGANIALAHKYDHFSDPWIKELGLCPICLIKEGECFCVKDAKEKEMLDTNRYAHQIEVRDRFIMGLTYVCAALIITIGVLVAKIAYGEPLPYPKGKSQCAAGYRDSGSYCVPMNSKAPDAVPKVGALPVKLAPVGRGMREE